MKAVYALSFSLVVAGCAIRPAPEQVTGVTTFEIVNQIRCETRQAVFDTLVDLIISNPEFGESAQRIALRFRGNPKEMPNFSPTRFAGDAKEVLSFYWKTGIAYNFSLDMTETNNLDTEINLLRTFTNGSQGFGFKAGLDRDRQNVRTFTLTDDFAGLLNLEPRNYCDGRLVAENMIYPMAGKIGIEPFIREFINISSFANLGSEEDGPPTMVDTLAFTTTISGSATPKVTFSPVGKSLDASLTAEVVRKDIHTLTMGLSVVPPEVPSPSASRSKGLFGRLLTAQGGGKRKTAAEAVDQELTKRALSRTVIVQQQSTPSQLAQALAVLLGK